MGYMLEIQNIHKTFGISHLGTGTIVGAIISQCGLVFGADNYPKLNVI